MLYVDDDSENITDYSLISQSVYVRVLQTTSTVLVSQCSVYVESRQLHVINYIIRQLIIYELINNIRIPNF